MRVLWCSRGGQMRWLLVVACVLVPGLVEAQSLTALSVTFYRSGASTPAVAPFDIPIAAMTCGQSRPTVSGTQINPTQYRVADPTAPTLDCVYNEAAGGPLFLLPIDGTIAYTARARWRNAVDVGPESADSNPFSRPGLAPTATPAALRIVRAGS